MPCSVPTLFACVVECTCALLECFPIGNSDGLRPGPTHTRSCTQADHCIRNMKPYVDSKGIEVGGGYDYASFVNILFTAA